MSYGRGRGDPRLPTMVMTDQAWLAEQIALRGRL